MKSFYEMVQLLEAESKDFFIGTLNITALNKCLMQLFQTEIKKIFNDKMLSKFPKDNKVDKFLSFINKDSYSNYDILDIKSLIEDMYVMFKSYNITDLESVNGKIIQEFHSLLDVISFVQEHRLKEHILNQYNTEKTLFKTMWSDDKIRQHTENQVVYEIAQFVTSFKTFEKEFVDCLLFSKKPQDSPDWRPDSSVPEDYYAL